MTDKVTLLFDWKYYIFVENANSPLVLAGRNHYTFNRNLGLEQVKKEIIDFIISNYKKDGLSQLKPPYDKIVNEQVKMFNIREVNKWSGLEDF